MMPFYLKKIFLLALILRGVFVVAQPANDNCDAATPIRLVDGKFCSSNGQFTNVRATTAFVSSATFCLGSDNLDVWFSFRATATDVKITIQGATDEMPTGTLTRPEAALYVGGDCATFSETACAADRVQGIIEMYKGGLAIGEVYYLRVQGGDKRTGTFKLCINNYNSPAAISSDCPTGTVLCDKSSFAVRSVTGAGLDRREIEDADCFGASSPTEDKETNSTWFKWTCLQSGSLSFNITPNRLDDDIDFVIYELPNGIDNCGGKRLLRCMASGTSPGVPGRPGCAILGLTGLRDGETDVSELGGCTPSQNQSNFLRPLDMEAGKSYALVINNFTSTGNGFDLDFGGSGTFLGPNAKIEVNRPDKKYCLGEDVIVTNASTFSNGRLTSFDWKFGKNASIDSAKTSGPIFRPFYKTPGWKSIVLTVGSDRGCRVTTIVDSIFIKGFQYDSARRAPTCNGGRDGLLRMRVASCGRPPIRYNWNGQGFRANQDSISNLVAGNYNLLVTDSSGLYIDTFRFDLREFEVEIDKTRRAVTPPLCFGLSNGKIELSPTTGLAPYRFKWNDLPNFIGDSVRTALGEGQYVVEIRDDNNCKGSFAFDVVAPPPVEVTLDTFNISCFGRTDGMSVAYPSGGVGNYSVSWSNGALGDTVRNLRAGDYFVFVTDSNKCPTQASLRVTEPDQITIQPLRIQPARCFGDSTAELVFVASGGTPPFRYSLEGLRFQRDTAFLKIPARNYTVVVRDSTNCRSTLEIDVPQPPPLLVNLGTDLQIDLGFPVELRATVVPSTAEVSYRWGATPKDSTLTCLDCPNPSAMPVENILYNVTIRDSMGCTAFDEQLVEILKKRPVFIPNVFTPNSDGVNDAFNIFGNQAALEIVDLKIFNRWGDLVYKGQNLPLNSPAGLWNGTMNGVYVAPDVFAYVAVIRFIDGASLIFKGDVTVVY